MGSALAAWVAFLGKWRGRRQWEPFGFPDWGNLVGDAKRDGDKSWDPAGILLGSCWEMPAVLAVFQLRLLAERGYLRPGASVAITKIQIHRNDNETFISSAKPAGAWFSDLLDGQPPPDELSDGESSDDELSDGESSDEEDPEDEGSTKAPPPPGGAHPSTSLGSGATTTSISSRSTTVAIPATTLLTTTSQPAKETATTSPQLPVSDSSSSSLPPASSAPTSSQGGPVGSTSTQISSSSAIPTVSTSPIPVLSPGNPTTSTSVLSQSTDDAQTGGPTNVPQVDNAINPPDEGGSSTSSNPQRAGQIAGGTIAFIGLIFFAYPAPPPGKSRSPSSIMNQLMTAAYAAEDGAGYRNSAEAIDNYANEKQQFTAYRGESTERLTVPAAAQLRPPSIAARTETTDKTESTWKTWGVLAGSSRVSMPRNWWVDRYFRT
ncbi:hypothetical protein EKO27_g6665 [Xylaria grammica]|uniref:Uncharacterized protein n=1 Tax=Xylaria grammica TaxID=363999 RepID=A0A439D2A3_9PEZI|nr:hypothetical protein EKO27_g6665 [Xylaria grammica]